MKFKDDSLQSQYDQIPKKLKEICQRFEEISLGFSKVPVITRIFTPVPGDSGVHEAHRAVDFRDETVSGCGIHNYLYTPEEVHFLTETLNNEYRRMDGKLVCIHHSFKGGMYHFHVQIPVGWLEPDTKTPAGS